MGLKVSATDGAGTSDSTERPMGFTQYIYVYINVLERAHLSMNWFKTTVVLSLQ